MAIVVGRFSAKTRYKTEVFVTRMPIASAIIAHKVVFGVGVVFPVPRNVLSLFIA